MKNNETLAKYLKRVIKQPNTKFVVFKEGNYTAIQVWIAGYMACEYGFRKQGRGYVKNSFADSRLMGILL